jgi:hypothetical protein
VWTSATPSTTIAYAQPANLAIVFRTRTLLPNGGTFTITASKQVFLADVATTCTVNNGGDLASSFSSIAASGTGKILTLTAGPSPAPTVAASTITVTCTSNLARNPAAGAVTFTVASSAEASTAAAETGYTTTAGSISSFSAAVSSKVIGETPAWLELTFTTQGTLVSGESLVITANNTVFSGTGSAACTVIVASTPVTTIASTTVSGQVLTVTANGAVPAGVTKVKCYQKLAASTAGATGFAITSPADTNLVNTQGYTPATTGVHFVSAVPTTAGSGTASVSGVAPTQIAFTFKTKTALATGAKFIITASSQIFTADVATTCAVTVSGTDSAALFTTIAASGTGTVLTLTRTGTGTFAAGTVVVTCTSNLKAAGAAGTALTFTVNSGSETTTVAGQLGWTIVGTIGTFTAVPSTLVIGETPAWLELQYTTTAGLASGQSWAITANNTVFSGSGAAACTVTVGGTATTTFSSISVAGQVLTLTANAAVTSGVVLVKCTDKLAATTAGARSFGIATVAEGNLVTTAGYVASATGVSWVSATPSTNMKGLTPTTHAFVFKTKTKLPGSGTFIITASQQIFAANGATNCTVNNGSDITAQFSGTKKGVASGTTGKILTLTLLSTGTVSAGTVTVTCLDNLAVNPTTINTTVTFTLASSAETNTVAGQVGYTVINTPAPTASPTASPTTFAATIPTACVAGLPDSLNNASLTPGTGGPTFAALIAEFVGNLMPANVRTAQKILVLAWANCSTVVTRTKCSQTLRTLAQSGGWDPTNTAAKNLAGLTNATMNAKFKHLLDQNLEIACCESCRATPATNLNLQGNDSPARPHVALASILVAVLLGLGLRV